MSAESPNSLLIGLRQSACSGRIANDALTTSGRHCLEQVTGKRILRLISLGIVCLDARNSEQQTVRNFAGKAVLHLIELPLPTADRDSVAKRRPVGNRFDALPLRGDQALDRDLAVP